MTSVTQYDDTDKLFFTVILLQEKNTTRVIIQGWWKGSLYRAGGRGHYTGLVEGVIIQGRWKGSLYRAGGRGHYTGPVEGVIIQGWWEVCAVDQAVDSGCHWQDILSD